MITDATTMRAASINWRRTSILEAVVGSALLAVSILCALQNETWHAQVSGFVAGATLCAAVMTFAKARMWERVAAAREKRPTTTATEG